MPEACSIKAKRRRGERGEKANPLFFFRNSLFWRKKEGKKIAMPFFSLLLLLWCTTSDVQMSPRPPPPLLFSILSILPKEEPETYEEQERKKRKLANRLPLFYPLVLSFHSSPFSPSFSLLAFLPRLKSPKRKEGGEGGFSPFPRIFRSGPIKFLAVGLPCWKAPFYSAVRTTCYYYVYCGSTIL